ncbi:hypothetical protein FRC00_003098 [Tulasnella sp. 408]|nr:hypothetical protein FRC00_003098 [Tulasnella sp. 408]
MWDVLGRAKWQVHPPPLDAWDKQKGLDAQQAKWLYVQTLQKPLSDDDRSSTSSVPAPTPIATSRPAALYQPQPRPSSGMLPSTIISPPPLEEQEAEHYVEQPLGQVVEHPAEHPEQVLSDEEERHDVVRPDLMSPPTNSAVSVRPQSSLSSQVRYRTPRGSSYAPTPVNATPIAPPQPLPRYATPSAFAPVPLPPPGPPGPPTIASYPTSMSYSAPPMQQPIMTGMTGSSVPHTYTRSATLTHGLQMTRTPLEKAVEAMQASLAALHERMDSMEAALYGHSPQAGSVQTPGGRRGIVSPLRGPMGYFAGTGGIPFDPHQTGAWSIILVPLARIMGRVKQLVYFLLYPPEPSKSTARLIVIRRLFLDASFVLSVLAAIRAIWKVTGIRRREVALALIGVWYAITGKQPRMLAEKAVGH